MTTSITERLRHIIRHAYHNAPALRAIFDTAGLTPEDIISAADLDKIPVTGKDRLVQLQQENPPFGGFLAAPLEQLQHVFLSPGPLYEPHAGEKALQDTLTEMLSIAGFLRGDVALNAFGYHLIPTGLALDEALREIGVTVIPAGVGSADLQIKMMLDLGVTAYLGTPSWLMALVQKASEMGVDGRLRDVLRKALVSAEPLPPALRQTFVEGFGLAVTNAYGTAELGFLAYNSEGGLAMHLLESSIVQVVHPETGQSVAPGEVGEVVVTSFNETYPLIRLGTGDLAMYVDPRPGESRQGERSMILVGRVGDAVKVRGMFVHPNQLRFAAMQVGGVAGIQAVVMRPENRDVFTLRVVLSDASADRQAVSAAISAAIQSACRVKVDALEFVAEIGEGQALIVDRRTWD